MGHAAWTSCTRLLVIPHDLNIYANRDRAEFITDTFASELPRLAKEDWLVSKVGVPEFVLSVITPELTTMLIKDDMKVGDEEARDILERSEVLGMTLNDVD